jgi:GNAT superfamily N-acetyltransferase
MARTINNKGWEVTPPYLLRSNILENSMYKSYVEEQLENRKVVEFPQGFVTYNIKGEECQLEEIYIRPEFRRQGFASKVYTQMSILAKREGCTYLKGSIVIGTNGSEVSMKCLFKNGFKLAFNDDNIIYLIKHIGG